MKSEEEASGSRCHRGWDTLQKVGPLGLGKLEKVVSGERSWKEEALGKGQVGGEEEGCGLLRDKGRK